MFVNDQRHGLGKSTTKENEDNQVFEYSGSWVDGQQDGKGELTILKDNITSNYHDLINSSIDIQRRF